MRPTVSGKIEREKKMGAVSAHQEPQESIKVPSFLWLGQRYQQGAAQQMVG